jgi:hypothetical protein
VPLSNSVLAIQSYISQTLHCSEQTPDKKNLQEEGFILVHDLQEFCTWLLGPVNLGRPSWQGEDVEEQAVYLTVDKKAENGA